MLVARFVARAWSAAGREPPIAPKRFAFFRNGRVVDGARAAAELGYRPAVPVGIGVERTARWYRDAGWL
jgi:nucleoside-diphosphate-sugar epimerase